MSEARGKEANYLAHCRICAKVTVNAIDLFAAEHEGKKFFEMLEFCLQQPIETDGLPRIICNACSITLIAVHKFHTLYYNSEHYFRRISSAADSKVKLEVESDIDESPIKVEESEGHIVVLPDISYFDNEHFEAPKLLNATTKNVDRIGSSFKSPSTRIKSLKRSKALGDSKRSRKLTGDQQHGEFECFECKKVFSHFSNLQEHASSHIKNAYECSECHIKFIYLKSLFRHRRQKHQTRVYECEYCTEAFESLSKLKQHITHTHKHQSKSYKCGVCSKTFLLHFQLLYHQTEDICTQNFQCPDCDEAFPMHRMLKSHIRDKHTSKCC